MRTRKKVEKVEGKSTKAIRRKIYGEEEEELSDEVHVFETEPAYVRATAGVTKNLGDFESLRLDVSITLPCYAEDADKTYLAAADWVYDRLADEIEEYTGENKNATNKAKPKGKGKK